MSYKPRDIELNKGIPPIPQAVGHPPGSLPPLIPKKSRKENEDSYPYSPFKYIIVDELHVDSGELPIVALLRCKTVLNKLIRSHNTLGKIIEASTAPHKDQWRAYMPKDQTFEVVGWLFAIQFTCNCVTSGPYYSGRYALWCLGCNRLVNED